MRKMDEIRYPLPDIDIPDEEPSYGAVLDWMRVTKGRSVSFDFWARGNYTRRLLRNRAKEISPLLVRVENVGEMRWAYRRLALVGSSLEFIYAGKCEKAKVLHLCPFDMKFDAGWGYMGALGSQCEIAGRRFFPITGHAKLMPEAVLDWLVDEAAEEFLIGGVFVAPAELIGIDPGAAPAELTKHTELVGGSSLTEGPSDACAIMEMKIPFIDRLSPGDFRNLINDSADQLASFRQAFHEYVCARDQGAEKAKEVLRHLCAEIDELMKSDKHIPFRKVVGAAGGLLSLTAAVVCAVSGEMSALLGAAGALMTGAKSAADVHQYLRGRSREAHARVSASPYAMFWKLGMTSPMRFKAAKRVRVGRPARQSSSAFNPNAHYHWLCPPTPGIVFPAVRKE
ncbi:MAG: hypothetical protein Q8Q12_00820 [bacterium]|nr:hypothetical protein [bacterium]